MTADMPDRLWAKSPQGDRHKTIVDHTVDVLDAAEALFGGKEGPTRLGRRWLEFFQIPLARFPVFRLNLLAAAGFHDLGKATDSFQEAVLHNQEQVVRHEHVSAMILGLPAIRDWLASVSGLDIDLVLSAVLTHHLKAKADGFAKSVSARQQFRLYGHHADFCGVFDEVAERLAPVPSPPRLDASSMLWRFEERATPNAGFVNVLAHRLDVQGRSLRRLETAIRKDDDRRRLLWSVRAALIAADAAGSGLPREGKSIRPWLEDMFAGSRLCDAAFVRDEVIEKRIGQLRRQGKWRDWSEFQNNCTCLPDRALLLAPCGSGKTLAAWRWIEARVGRRPARVVFLYPTRATAKEGFRDYVSWAPESDAALLHAASEFDLQGMFVNPEEGDERGAASYTVERRLYSLAYWERRVFSATVDQFLAFLQYGYGSMCLLPLLVESVVVIDEVHSFDTAMFSALKAFLKEFDVPVLCMTASLRNDQRAALESECRLTVDDDKPGELLTIAKAARYRLNLISEPDAAGLAIEALRQGKRVLWVINKVRRAQETYFRLAQRLGGLLPLCYHSRFTLNHRVARHDAVVQAMRPGMSPTLALTTQVCELSLDIDADVLITEHCPITSLIQRMGRCNRARGPRSEAGEVYVYQPVDNHGRADTAPYDAAALTGVDPFIDILADRTQLSQIDLEIALSNSPNPPALGDRASSFIASGPYAWAAPEDFRDGEDFTVQAVLAGELERVVELRKRRQPIDGFIVPIPRWPTPSTDERLPNYVRVGDDAYYDQFVGYCNSPVAHLRSLFLEGE